MHCGIDPGRCKTGWAVADDELRLVASGIVPTENLHLLLEWVLARAEKHIPSQWCIEGNVISVVRPVSTLWCGQGTGSAAVFDLLQKKIVTFQAVDERGSTLEARQMYWFLHPPQGWRRLFPLSWQVPPRPLDDLAAYCIARRGLLQQRISETKNK